METEDCLLCCEPIEYEVEADCQHSGSLCAICALRLRLYSKKKAEAQEAEPESHLLRENKKKPKPKHWLCPFCKKQWKKVTIKNKSPPKEDKSSQQKKQSSGSKGSSLQFAQNPIRDDEIGAFFEDADTMQHLKRLRSIYCVICQDNQLYPSLSELDKHLQRAHQRFLCSACCESMEVFVHERQIMTKSELVRHFKEGRPPDIPPHPFCSFCDVPYFSEDELQVHRWTQHSTCKFCEKRDRNKCYFANSNALNDHQRREHAVCEFLECQAKFDTRFDLDLHMMAVHKDALSPQHQRALQATFLGVGPVSSPPSMSSNSSRPGGGGGGGGGGSDQDQYRDRNRGERGDRGDHGDRGDRGGQPRDRRDGDRRRPDDNRQKQGPISGQTDRKEGRWHKKDQTSSTDSSRKPQPQGSAARGGSKPSDSTESKIAQPLPPPAPEPHLILETQERQVMEVKALEAIYPEEFSVSSPLLAAAIERAVDLGNVRSSFGDEESAFMKKSMEFEVALRGVGPGGGVVTLVISLPPQYPSGAEYPPVVAVRCPELNQHQLRTVQLEVNSKAAELCTSECIMELLEWAKEHLQSLATSKDGKDDLDGTGGDLISGSTGGVTATSGSSSSSSSEVSDGVDLLLMTWSEPTKLLQGLIAEAVQGSELNGALFLGQPLSLLLGGSRSALDAIEATLRAVEVAATTTPSRKGTGGGISGTVTHARCLRGQAPKRLAIVPAVDAEGENNDEKDKQKDKDKEKDKKSKRGGQSSGQTDNSSTVDNSASGVALTNFQNLAGRVINTKALVEHLDRVDLLSLYQQVLRGEPRYTWLYTITVKTGEGRHCSTDGVIGVQIFGGAAFTEPLLFPSGAMKSACESVLQVKAVAVGPVSYLTITNDSATAWRCQWIKLGVQSVSGTGAAKVVGPAEYVVPVPEKSKWVQKGQQRRVYTNTRNDAL